jgi:hypothetical protein
VLECLEERKKLRRSHLWRTTDSPDHHDSSPEAAAAQLGAQSLDSLLVVREARKRDGLSGRFHVANSRVKMVRYTFEFGVYDADVFGL